MAEMQLAPVGTVRFRKLRIAWSVVCGVVGLCLMALWVRSYSTIDMISRMDGRKIATTFASQDGTLFFAHFDAAIAYKSSSNSTAPRDWAYKSLDGYRLNNGPFVFERDQTSIYIVLPHWLFAIGTVLIGAIPWFHWQFSLRALLIAVTLVAVMLGVLFIVLRGQSATH
jgi:hypothetical protein